MVNLAIEKLDDQHQAEAIRELVLALNGRPTMVQMQQIVERLDHQLPGHTVTASDLYEEYLSRLLKIVNARRQKVVTREESDGEWVVPGAHQMLSQLRDRGVALYAASGTELDQVLYEAELLGLTGYFGRHIYGPGSKHASFSKGEVVVRILQELGLEGSQLLGFGDGVAEIREVKAVGGAAVGIASVARGESGRAEWKRAPLVEAGADLIIPDYQEQDRLLQWLFMEV